MVCPIFMFSASAAKAMRRDASPLSSASSSVWTCTMKAPIYSIYVTHVGGQVYIYIYISLSLYIYISIYIYIYI